MMVPKKESTNNNSKANQKTLENVKRKGNVKDALIESKDQRWHCRNRVSLVFGSNDIEELETYVYDDAGNLFFKTIAFHQAKSKAIEEILDNAIDEFYREHVTEIHLSLSSDRKIVSISDNGIGFPLDKIRAVYTEFRTGSKFRDEDLDEKGFLNRTLGQNGLGAAATCLTCDFFKVTVKHYISKKEQTYLFIDGSNDVKKTPPKPFTGSSGVLIELSLASEVYKNNTIDYEILRKRVIDLAYNNPGLTFYFNEEKFLFKKGLTELPERLSLSSNHQYFPLGEETYIYSGTNSKNKPYKGQIDLSIAMAFAKEDSGREKFISFVNSTPTYDGGFHHEKFKRIFTSMVKDKIERMAKREGVVITDNDLLMGMIIVIGIKMPNPRFESQTKRKLVRDNELENGLQEFMGKNVEKFLKKSPQYLEAVIERAQHRQRFEEMKEATKKGKQQRKVRVEKLLDANERKDRAKCTLFICEGDSAIGGLRSARDKLYQGGMAIKGKPMNISQATIKDILANQELCDIMAAIGLTLGQPPEFDKLRFSKVVFLADADVDGGHINTLLTNFFFSFWPELFMKGMIQIARPPLYEVITSDSRKIYVESTSALEDLKKRSDIKIKEIQRNKGLGEMSSEAFRELLAKRDFIKINVPDVENAKKALEVCFGKDAGLRKELLLDVNNDD